MEKTKKNKEIRFLLKALTWRVLSSSYLFVISYIVSGNVEFGIALITADALGKTVLYYLHEKIWNKRKEQVIVIKHAESEDDVQ